jgi:hypothetical protein
MTADASIGQMARCPAQGTRPQRTRSRQKLGSALLVAAVVSACSGNGDATTETPSTVVTVADPPNTETSGADTDIPREIGPRALDVDAAVMMVVDAIDVSGDDLFVRVRVVNASDQFLNVEANDALYGPLLVMSDNRDNVYPARAVEPAGVDVYSVGQMRFRFDGPMDSDAEEITFEISTSRGRFRTEPTAVPDGGIARWWIESPTIAFSDLVVSDGDNRIVQVVEIADRGTHIDLTVQASDASDGFALPGDVKAELTLDDGTTLESLPFSSSAARQSNEFTAVLRFLGTLPSEPGALTLHMAGVDLEIPLNCANAACLEQPPAIEPAAAASPRLPDLLDLIVKPEPLPTSTISL